MNILVLDPGKRALAYTYFSTARPEPLVAATINEYRGAGPDETSSGEAVHEILFACTHEASEPVDAVALRVAFGGTHFSGPTLVSAPVVHALKELVRDAPMHLPLVLTLIRACQAQLPGVPIVLAFDTAFSVGLPPREYVYALDAELTGKLAARRYAFQGPFHAAACRKATARCQQRRADPAPGIVSLCLDNRPEVAAALGTRPVMVTGGITPLEGLPGRTTCGELDPSIVLTISKEMGWGPEQVNAVLTEESGLAGLAGQPTTLADVFGSDDPALQLARHVMEYRILQACGAAMAGLGSIEALVFSGRYAAVGKVLGPWLASRLSFEGGPRRAPIELVYIEEPLHRIIADEAAALVLQTAAATSA